MFADHKSALLQLTGILCLTAGILSDTTSVIGDVTINISKHKFVCDNIECPLNSDRCVVTKEKDPNNEAALVRSNICYSRSNEVLKKSVTNQSIDPNSNVKMHIEASRNGMINIVNSISSYNSRDFDEAKFQQKLTKKMSNLEQRMKNTEDRINMKLRNIFHKYT